MSREVAIQLLISHPKRMHVLMTLELNISQATILTEPVVVSLWLNQIAR